MVSDFRKEHSELGKIINPIIEKYNLPRKEILEVCQIGKFAYKVNSEIKIIEKPKPPDPDFIIELNSKLIGLEHTRVFTENADNYNRVISIIHLAEEIFSSQFPNDIVSTIISIKDDRINYKQIEKRKLATELANYIYNSYKGVEIEIPSFVAALKVTKHSKLSFSYKEKKWQGPYLTKERLEIEIKKKEKKIEKYKKGNNKITEFWLVLLVGSLNSASYQLDENLNYKTESIFDQVYLMADFDAEIIRIN